MGVSNAPHGRAMADFPEWPRSPPKTVESPNAFMWRHRIKTATNTAKASRRMNVRDTALINIIIRARVLKGHIFAITRITGANYTPHESMADFPE